METTDTEQATKQPAPTEVVDLALRGLADGNTEQLGGTLAELTPTETANLLESMPPTQRQQTWDLLPEASQGEVLGEIGDKARAALIDTMDPASLATAATQMNDEDFAEVLDDLPKDLTETVLDALDRDHRERIEAVLSYPEDSAGRLMSTNVVSVRSDVTLGVVLRWLRHHHSLPPHTDALMVIDDDGRYAGKLSLADVVTGDPAQKVAEVMQVQADTVHISASQHEVAALFARRDLISVAVLDDDNRLVGRITADDVIDIIRAQADRQLLHSGGLEQDADLFAPVLPSAIRRGLWLGINLLTVFLASWVIGHFEEALDKIVALAVLLPVVASMGGIAGSQTLTLAIRGLALDQITAANTRWLVAKEVAVAALNGVVWAVLVALVSWAWFGSIGIAAVIAAAMVLNLLAAGLSGVVIPLFLKRMGIDPALSGAVILTTVTDIIGFMSFLGLATLFLL